MIIQLLAEGPARPPSIKDVEGSDAVFILGEDISNTAPRLALALTRSVRQKPMAIAQKLHIPFWDAAAVREAIQDEKGPLFIATPAGTRLDAFATSVFQAAPDELACLGFAVAKAVHEEAHAVCDLTEDMKAQAELIAQALRDAEHPLVISGTALGNEAVIEAAANVAWALCASGKKASLYCVTPECNSLGLGLFGGRPLEEAAEILESKSADTLIIAENDLYRRAAPDLINRILGAAQHVIVIDHLENATTARADVVLPAATFAEGTGTYVSSEGRAQRYYRVFDPGGNIRESGHWIQDIMSATENFRAPSWQNLDDVTAAMGEDIPVLKRLRDGFPGADFRMAGQKIPRQPHRYSGRTAMTAHVGVHEQKPPDDHDSALAISMEGFAGEPPPALIPRFWAPGWNSVQSVNKFQDDVGGPLRGDDPGICLLNAANVIKPSYFPGVAPLKRAPSHGEVLGEVLAVPVYYVFGSEELSARAPGIAGLVPAPHIALNPVDAKICGSGDGQTVGISLPGGNIRFPVRIDESLPPGVVGIPAGLPGFAGIMLPAWGVLCLDDEERERGT
jgi:NADH-quinone oxidoreductase subunit G